MINFGHVLRTAAVTSLVSAALLMGPAMAQSQQPVDPYSAKAKVAPGGGPAARAYSTPERVEARIADLHEKLAISSAQEPAWNRLAETMRDNAAAVESQAADREKALQTMTVMDDLRSYEALSKAHADGMTKLIAAFGPLYASMPADQQKKADAEFLGYRKRVSTSTAQ